MNFCSASNNIWVGAFNKGNHFTLVEVSNGHLIHAAGGCDMRAVEAIEMPGIILGDCAKGIVVKKSA